MQGDRLIHQISRIATRSDLDRILALQSLNLYTNLSPLEREMGFVTTEFSREQVTTLIDLDGVFVSERSGEVVGYILAGSWDFFVQWPIFPFIEARLSQLTFVGWKLDRSSTFEYGPICLDRSVRGSNILPNLFDLMSASFRDRYPIGITFINRLNPRSLAAHTRKLNLQIIDEFEFNGGDFYCLAFETNSSG
jgi:hypothetical protein